MLTTDTKKDAVVGFVRALLAVVVLLGIGVSNELAAALAVLAEAAVVLASVLRSRPLDNA